ncbi:hypothetical protein [Streptomyces sp. PvR034]|uniref:hypothetical protein n=1 Tax=Streptomyces sp. PvR034 TaxID=3156401 RepID=UPI003391BDB0
MRLHHIQRPRELLPRSRRELPTGATAGAPTVPGREEEDERQEDGSGPPLREYALGSEVLERPVGAAVRVNPRAPD